MTDPKNIKHPIILFDGVCNLCAGSVQFIIKRDNSKYFRFASLQSDFAKIILQPSQLSENNFSSIIFTLLFFCFWHIIYNLNIYSYFYEEIILQIIYQVDGNCSTHSSSFLHLSEIICILSLPGIVIVGLAKKKNAGYPMMNGKIYLLNE